MVELGQKWRYNGLDQWLISYTSLPPVWIDVTVVWVTDLDVYYRKIERPTKLEQKTLNRFLETFELSS